MRDGLGTLLRSEAVVIPSERSESRDLHFNRRRATLSNSRTRRQNDAPLPRPMPYTDPIVLGLLLLSLIGSLVFQWRRGLRGGRLAVVTVAMFYGLAAIIALSMHTLDVLYGYSHRNTSFATGKPVTWDWHTYSLLLFGVLMVWFGAQCLRLALRLGRGDASARSAFLRFSGVILLVVLPLIPIQALFGVVAAALSVIALLVVGLGGRT